jgi:hypothetical protein
MKDIDLYSDPQLVLKKVHKIFGKDTDLYLSTRKNKKFMILNEEGNKFIHFGLYPYEDFTKTKDKTKRDAFKSRNHKWANA